MGREDIRDFGAMIVNSLYPPPEAKKVLILAPHPDDETLGCGGTIALYAIKGTEVHVAIISDGGKIPYDSQAESINIVETRKRETIDASRILGVRQTYFLGFPDGELTSYKNEINDKIMGIIKEISPEFVFAPSPIDYHADHIAVSEVALSLLNKIPNLKVAFYEIYETIRFDILVDITDVMHLKEKAILNYTYSLFECPDIFFEAVKGLNMFKSFYTRQKRYYEAFWLVSEPLEKSQIIEWITYGRYDNNIATVFLSKIRAVDELLYELKKCDDLLKSKDSDIEMLKATIKSSEKDVEELMIMLADINHSLFGRLATKYYRMRDRLLPQGSILRKFYDNVMTHIKAR